MNWLRRILRLSHAPQWTHFGWASVCDYRGFTVVVSVAGSSNAFVWEAYCAKGLRWPIAGLPPFWNLRYFEYHKTSYAIARGEAMQDAIREVDRFIGSTPESAA